jgi:heterodisulfide reductase subunit C
MNDPVDGISPNILGIEGRTSMSAVQTAFAPSSQLATAIQAESGTNVNRCFQCGKCAAGCPVAYAMDFTPTELIHAIQLGIDDMVLKLK